MKRNPSVKGKLCIFCGRKAEAHAHLQDKGLGGLGKKADPSRDDGVPACGFDHFRDPRSCHYALARDYLKAERLDDGNVRFIVTRDGDKWFAKSYLARNHPELHAGLFYIATHQDEYADEPPRHREAM